ncbi:MAG: peptide-methionine (R)-S-oxide reductase MsrB [Phycisphaeraceae bacterium]
MQTTGKVQLTDEQWRAILSTEEYDVLRQSGTEMRFTGRYLNNKQQGAYHCVGCGNKLYDAEHKFHSGCGWPSFFQEIEKDSITTHVDRSVGMVRTEMRCARCDGHLGHIFADAPDQPTGLRHCVNGTALIFVPEDADIKEVFRAHRAKYADQ